MMFDFVLLYFPSQGQALQEKTKEDELMTALCLAQSDFRKISQGRL
jgi:hypothetical protein